MDHFWFSKKQFLLYEMNGDHPCLAQLHDGKIVEYTECTQEKIPGGKWDDYEYLGTGEFMQDFPPVPGSLSEFVDNAMDEEF